MGRKSPKTKSIGARVSDEMFAEVQAWLDFHEITMGQLVRSATREYMWGHPMNRPSKLNQEEDNE